MPGFTTAATLSLVLDLPGTGTAGQTSAVEQLRALLDGHAASATWTLTTAQEFDGDLVQQLHEQHELAWRTTGSQLWGDGSRRHLAGALHTGLAAFQRQGLAATTLVFDEFATPRHGDLLVKHGVRSLCVAEPTDSAAQRRWKMSLFGSGPTTITPCRALRWGLWQLPMTAVDDGRFFRKQLASLAHTGGKWLVRMAVDNATAFGQVGRLLQHAAPYRVNRQLRMLTVADATATLLPGRTTPPATSVLRRSAA